MFPCKMYLSVGSLQRFKVLPHVSRSRPANPSMGIRIVAPGLDIAFLKMFLDLRMYLFHLLQGLPDDRTGLAGAAPAVVVAPSAASSCSTSRAWSRPRRNASRPPPRPRTSWPRWRAASTRCAAARGIKGKSGTRIVRISQIPRIFSATAQPPSRHRLYWGGKQQQRSCPAAMPEWWGVFPPKKWARTRRRKRRK